MPETVEFQDANGGLDSSASSSSTVGSSTFGSPTFGEPSEFRCYRGTSPPRFANRYELEYAKVLDFYGVPWDYEPCTFVLAETDDGRVAEAFTPDFYLPEQDLYLELTVMKQSLVTRKNRKLRKLRERYPDVKIKVFYKRDIARLAERFKLPIAS